MINPVLFHIGFLQIRWYGILMALGFLFAYVFIMKYCKEFNLSKKHSENLFTYLLIAAIIGARLFEVLFYDFNYYHNNPIKIFYLWEGGLASHGALIAMLLVVYFYSRKHKLKFYAIADLFVIPAALVSSFVRFGNFINQELPGKLTTFFLGMKFNNESFLRHPIQLYQVFSNLFLFGILLSIKKIKNRKSGLIFWSFLFLFSIFRFFIEFLRDLPASYGHIYFGLNVAQLTSIIIFIISIYPLYNRIKN